MPRTLSAVQWDGEAIDSMLQEYPVVKAVLSGHHHKGAQTISGNTHHFTFEGMIDGTENHYAVVKVFRNRIEIDGYGHQPSANLSF